MTRRGWPWTSTFLCRQCGPVKFAFPLYIMPFKLAGRGLYRLGIAEKTRRWLLYSTSWGVKRILVQHTRGHGWDAEAN